MIKLLQARQVLQKMSSFRAINNLHLELFIFLIGQLQLLSLSQDLNSFLEEETLTNFNILKLFYCIQIILRPYKLLTNYQTFSRYCFIFPTFCIFIIIMYLIYFILRINFFQKSETFKKPSLFFQIISIMIEVYPCILKVPLIEMLSISLISNIVNNFYFTNVIIIILDAILLVTFNILNVSFNESNNFPCPILKLEFLENKYVYEQIQLFPLLFFLQIKEDWSFYVTICLCLISQFIQIANINQVAQIFKVHSKLFVSSLNFVFSLFILISHFLNNQFTQIAFTVYLWPLTYYYALKYYDQIRQLNINKKRLLNQIYNNLILIFQHNSKQIKLNQISLIIFRMSQIHQYDNCFHQQSKITNQCFMEELNFFNSRIMKSHSSNKMEWYMKYILINKQLNLLNKCCQLITNFKHGYLFDEKEQLYVKVQENLSNNQIFHLNFNFKDTISLIIYNLRISSQRPESELITNYIQYKIKIEQYQLEFRDILKKKLELFNFLANKKTIIKKNQLFKEFYNFSEITSKFQQLVQDFFTQYNTSSIKSILLLLHAEIYNNYLEAIKINQQSTSSSNFVFQAQESQEFCVMQMENDLSQVKLLKLSLNLLLILKYEDEEQQNKLKTINQFLADDFQVLHMQMIQQFLVSGQSKFFRQFNLVFVRGNNDIYTFFEFQLYHQSSSINCLLFYGFFQKQIDQPLCFILNQYGIIVGFTRSLMKYLLQSNVKIDIQTFFYQRINLLMENFEDLNIEEILEGQTTEFKQNFIYDQIVEGRVVRCNNLYLVYIHNIKIKYDYKIKFQGKYEGELISSEESLELPYQFEQDLQESKQNIVLIDSNQQIISTQKIKTTQQFITQEKNYLMSPNSPIGSNRNLFQANQFESQKLINQKEEENLFPNMELQSSQCSRNNLDNSIYFKKYQKLNLYIDKNRFSKQYDMMVVCMLLLFVTNIVNYTVQSSNLIPELYQAGNDLDLVAIKSYFITPAQNCVTSQACVVNYILLAYMFQQISEEQAFSHMEFSVLGIQQSYDFFRDSFINQLNNPNLQAFFIDQELEAYMLSYNDLYKVNLTLRTGLYYYLNAQYTISQMDYYHILEDQSSQADFAYFMGNLQVLNEKFQQISVDILSYITDKVIVTQKFWTTLMLKLMLIQAIFLFISYQLYIKHQKLIKLQFDLLIRTKQQFINLEIIKLEILEKQLQIDDLQQTYKFDIKQKEIQLGDELKKYEGLARNCEIQTIKNSYNFQRKLLLIVFTSVFVLFFVPSYILNSYTNLFFTKYSASADLLKQLSTTSSSVTAIYQIKEVNYMINEKLQFFFFYTDQKRIDLNVGLLKELEHIQQFSQTLSLIENDEYLVNSQFLDLLEEMKSSNLCNFIVHYSKELAKPHCELVYNGVLKIGLVNTITEIYNKVSQEYINTDGFQVSKRTILATFEEMEIGLITSDALLALKQSYYECLLEITQQLITNIKIIILICICFDSTLILLIFYILRPMEKDKFGIIKNLIQLVPVQSIYIDQTFERDFRFLIMKYNL